MCKKPSYNTEYDGNDNMRDEVKESRVINVTDFDKYTKFKEDLNRRNKLALSIVERGEKVPMRIFKFGMYDIWHSDLTVAESASLFAIVSKVNDQYRIIVDDHFFQLNEFSQAQIIYHEKAHIDLGHLDGHAHNTTSHDFQWTTDGISDYDKNELEADELASNRLGLQQYIRGYELEMDYTSRKLGFINKTDEYRLEQIKKITKVTDYSQYQ